MSRSGWHLPNAANEGLALVYTRISETNTDFGVTRQKQICTERGAQEGALTFRYYTDNSKSATKADVVRPDYEKLTLDIRSGAVDGAMIICYAQDRLARRGREAEELFELFELHGIRFIAVADGTDIVPAMDGALIARIRAAVAAEEVRKLKRRLADALAQNRERGRRHGKLPFGWNPDGTLEPVQSMMIKDAVDRVIKGEPMAKICREWNEQNLPRISFIRRSVDGEKLPEDQQVLVEREWTSNSLRQILERPRLAGIYTHLGKRLDVTADWEAIISEDDHNQLMVRFAKRRSGEKVNHLLGGILVCGKCEAGAGMWGVTNRSEGYVYLLYRCRNCNHQVRVGETDDYVENIVVETLTRMTPSDLTDPESVEKLNAVNMKLETAQIRFREIENRYLDFTRDDAIDGQEHARLTGRLKPMIAKLSAERNAILDSATNDEHVLPSLIGPGAEEAWEVASFETKREVIRSLVHLTVLPGVRRTPIEERIQVDPFHPVAAAVAGG